MKNFRMLHFRPLCYKWWIQTPARSQESDTDQSAQLLNEFQNWKYHKIFVKCHNSVSKEWLQKCCLFVHKFESVTWAKASVKPLCLVIQGWIRWTHWATHTIFQDDIWHYDIWGYFEWTRVTKCVLSVWTERTLIKSLFPRNETILTCGVEQHMFPWV